MSNTQHTYNIPNISCSETRENYVKIVFIDWYRLIEYLEGEAVCFKHSGQTYLTNKQYDWFVTA